MRRATCRELQPVAELVELVRKRTERVDVLINCAGGFGAIGAIDQIDAAEWMQTVTNNLFGSFLTIKYFLPLLANSPAPRVINLSGGGAFSPFPNYSAYACSKAALVRLTETLAIELAPHGIAINAVAPGFVATRTHETTISSGPEGGSGAVSSGRTPAAAAGRRCQHRSHGHRLPLRTRAAVPGVPRTDRQNDQRQFRSLGVGDIPQSISTKSRARNCTPCAERNPVNLPEGHLRTSLMKTWAKHGIKR